MSICLEQRMKGPHAVDSRSTSIDTRNDGTFLMKDTCFLDKSTYLIMPTIVQGDIIGVFVVDLSESNHIIEDKDFLSFQQFCMQVDIALSLLSI